MAILWERRWQQHSDKEDCNVMEKMTSHRYGTRAVPPHGKDDGGY